MLTTAGSSSTKRIGVRVASGSIAGAATGGGGSGVPATNAGSGSACTIGISPVVRRGIVLSPYVIMYGSLPESPSKSMTPALPSAPSVNVHGSWSRDIAASAFWSVWVW